jgi:hypothetical protein
LPLIDNPRAPSYKTDKLNTNQQTNKTNQRNS